MKIEPKNNCPLDNFNPCRELGCAWFMKVLGKHPQRSGESEEWGCAIPWIPIMIIENSQMQRQTGAAVESFRNEMVNSNRASQNVLMTALAVQSKDIKIIENKP